MIDCKVGVENCLRTVPERAGFMQSVIVAITIIFDVKLKVFERIDSKFSSEKRILITKGLPRKDVGIIIIVIEKALIINLYSLI